MPMNCPSDARWDLSKTRLLLPDQLPESYFCIPSAFREFSSFRHALENSRSKHTHELPLQRTPGSKENLSSCDLPWGSNKPGFGFHHKTLSFRAIPAPFETVDPHIPTNYLSNARHYTTKDRPMASVHEIHPPLSTSQPANQWPPPYLPLCLLPRLHTCSHTKLSDPNIIY